MKKETWTAWWAAAALVACGGELSSQSVPVGKAVRMRLPAEVGVELDIFSGEPNPAWTLTQAERNAVLAELSHAEETGPQDMFDGLGYRGFVLSPAGAGHTPVVELRIRHGAIRYRAGETVTYWKDPDRRAERRLLSSARLHLEAKLYEHVRAQVG